MAELSSIGSEKTRSTYVRHCVAADRTFGVIMAGLKAMARTLRGNRLWPASFTRPGTWMPCTLPAWWQTGRS